MGRKDAENCDLFSVSVDRSHEYQGKTKQLDICHPKITPLLV